MAFWNGPIGPVTVVTDYGSSYVYATLCDAILAASDCRIVMSFDRPEGIPDDGFWRRPVILRDEFGMVVPLWRIDEEIATLGLFRPRRRAWGYIPDRDFRNGPVPHTGRRRGGHMFRRPGTHGERRELRGLEADLQDPDMDLPRIRIRVRRRNAPTAWDDLPIRGRGKSWKRHRKTRFREP